MSAPTPAGAPIPAIVLGGTGYVAGELLRLIAGHPQLDVAAVLSDASPARRLPMPSRTCVALTRT